MKKAINNKLKGMIKDAYQNYTPPIFTGLGGKINFDWAAKEYIRDSSKYTQEENLKYYKDLAESYHYKYHLNQHSLNTIKSKYERLKSLFKILWKKR